MATDRTAQLDELLTAYRAVLFGLLDATADLDDAAWGSPTGCPGWDVHDQLAHCVGLERRLLGDGELDPDVEVPDLPHLTGDVGRYLERDVQARRATPHDALVAEAQETFTRRSTQLSQLAPEHLDETTDTPFGPMRTASWLRTRLFDLTNHERDVRAAVDRIDGWSGPHVPIAVEQALRSWARALPRRLESDATVTIAVTGAPPVDLDLGAGALIRGEDVGTRAAAALQLTPASVLALAGGRADAPGLDELARRGDDALLGRLVAVAGVTP